MPRTISDDLKTHLEQEVTTVCTCWKIVCTDETIFTFTDHDADLVIDGMTYISSVGYQRTAIASDSQFTPDNLEVHGILDSNLIKAEDIAAGKFDFAEVTIFAVNYTDLSQGTVKLRHGWFGEVIRTPTGLFRAELRGLAQALSQRTGQSYTPSCRATFGDQRCRYPAYPPAWKQSTLYKVGDYISYPAPGSNDQYITDFKATAVTTGLSGFSYPQLNVTPGSTTTEGGITWTAQPRFRAIGTITGLITGTRSKFICQNMYDHTPANLKFGLLHWLTGANHGRNVEIQSYDAAGGELVIWLPTPYAMNIGDRFIVVPGCARTRSACKAYNNILNYRGEPDVPGIDMLVRYPAGH